MMTVRARTSDAAALVDGIKHSWFEIHHFSSRKFFALEVQVEYHLNVFFVSIQVFHSVSLEVQRPLQ